MSEPSPPVLRIASWNCIPGLVHGFFGRRGGVSRGACTSLNLSQHVGDDPQAVARNWAGVRRAMSGLDIVRMGQAHGSRILRVGTAAHGNGPADGLTTGTVGLGLTVLTADCVPVLMVAPAAHVVMALHAGWRGTLAGIAEVAVAGARTWFGVEGRDWLVALGPAIDGCCYEVDRAIGLLMENRWGSLPEAWDCTPTRGKLDLRLVNHRILGAAGVPAKQILRIGPCTACDSDGYFSHRRARGRAGRQGSVIGWAPYARTEC